MSRWRSFRAGPWATRRLTAEAAVWLVLAAVALKVLPFRWIAARCGATGGPAQAVDPGIQAMPLLPQVGRAVERAARRLPLRLACLPQALAAKAMLQRRGIVSTLHLGMALAEGRQMKAHAWLTASGVGVIGMAFRPGYTELAGFTPPP
ncbi:lasso peptide biosynthesis B2 protein [Pseudomonas silvicola]|nr:lasso peptide biosynthesis B2 protein [Pseudomonas silvicola]